MTGVDLSDRPRDDWKPAAVSDVTPRMSLVLQSFLPAPKKADAGLAQHAPLDNECRDRA